MSSPSQQNYQRHVINFIHTLPEAAKSAVCEQYTDHFRAVRKHFQAARNDCHWLFWSQPCFMVYCFWAAKWWGMCPNYFRVHYPAAKYWHEGHFMWETIPRDNSDNFPDDDKRSSLVHLPLRKRYEVDSPIGYCSFQAEYLDDMALGYHSKPSMLHYL